MRVLAGLWNWVALDNLKQVDLRMPADVRKRLGLSGGGAVYLDETEDGVVLRTAGQAVARAQALAKQYTDGNPDASVDAFLARRREESGE
ncbi:AbrB family transcriptional regulator [Sphingomonas yabuuchiae]|uniref:AbrB family transcriptional regulator n=2 Tax=Sphingomonas yabuuchiae TaxID=172044 RepID=A0A147IUT5_9SPHN|nr:AbrB family transcriptional regulator [Sphingomonas yabuuchiae]